MAPRGCLSLTPPSPHYHPKTKQPLEREGRPSIGAEGPVWQPNGGVCPEREGRGAVLGTQRHPLSTAVAHPSRAPGWVAGRQGRLDLPRMRPWPGPGDSRGLWVSFLPCWLSIGPPASSPRRDCGWRLLRALAPAAHQSRAPGPSPLPIPRPECRRRRRRVSAGNKENANAWLEKSTPPPWRMAGRAFRVALRGGSYTHAGSLHPAGNRGQTTAPLPCPAKRDVKCERARKATCVFGIQMERGQEGGPSAPHRAGWVGPRSLGKEKKL